MPELTINGLSEAEIEQLEKMADERGLSESRLIKQLLERELIMDDQRVSLSIVAPSGDW